MLDSSDDGRPLGGPPPLPGQREFCATGSTSNYQNGVPKGYEILIIGPGDSLKFLFVNYTEAAHVLLIMPSFSCRENPRFYPQSVTFCPISAQLQLQTWPRHSKRRSFAPKLMGTQAPTLAEYFSGCRCSFGGPRAGQACHSSLVLFAFRITCGTIKAMGVPWYEERKERGKELRGTSWLEKTCISL